MRALGNVSLSEGRFNTEQLIGKIIGSEREMSLQL